MAKRILSVLLSVVLVASSLIFVNAATIDDAPTSVTTPSSAASQAIDDKYGYDGNDLGATVNKDANTTTFKIWAPTATEVVLNLYATGSDSEEGAEDLGNFQMVKELNDNGDFTGIWLYTAFENLLNKYYTYTVTSYKVTDFDIETELPKEGSKPTVVETQDVYSVATGVNSARSMVCDLDSTDPDGWENDNHVVLDNYNESIVWEMHIKDFSWSKTSGVSDENRGKYLGVTERGTTLNGEGNVATCIDHLKEMGITTVEILPFYDFGSIKEDKKLDKQFNWGYDPMNYNVPEGSYSSNPYDGNVRIKECKQMIKALHDAGISVVMDVVYNHTYNTNSCFQAVVPDYYYRMKSNGDFSNGTGSANELASERRMFRNYMVQSVLHWVNEYHVDGFRFDLMGVIDVETMNIIRAELDKVDERLTMWGEGWAGGNCTFPDTTCTGAKTMGATQANAKYLDENIALFNDNIRDAVIGKALNKEDIGWVQGVGSFRNGVRQGIVANTKGGMWIPKSPAQCVTYLSCHDNTTLWDKLCDTHGLGYDYETRHKNVVAENKLAATIATMSLGVSFMQAGEEMGRSKQGDHNSYSSSPEINMIDWSLLEKNADIVSYYKGLIKIRNSFSPLTEGTLESSGHFIPKQPNARNTVTYYVSNDTEGQWKHMALLYNNAKTETEFTLSDPNIDEDMEWVIIVDDETAGFENLGEVKGNTFVIPPSSAIVAVDKESYNSVAKPVDSGKVVVEHIDTVENKVIDRFVMYDEFGNYYKTQDTTLTGNVFKLIGVEGDTTGTFKEETQYVKYFYDYYVPESLDINPDDKSKLNVNDVTFMQKALANMITLSDEEKLALDCNYDGEFSVYDITMLQQHLAGMSVCEGSVKVNYLKTDENGNPTTEVLARALTYTDRVGTEYTSKPTMALGYTLNKNLLPETETLKVAYGVVKEVTYYYDFVGSEVNVHVKHDGDLKWNPSIWIWGQQNGVDSGYNYCHTSSWPGDKLEHLEYTGNISVLNDKGYKSCDCLTNSDKNGEKEYPTTGSLNVGEYTLDNNIKVIHTTNCSKTSEINEADKSTHKSSLKSLLADGYTQCNECMSDIDTYVVEVCTNKIHKNTCKELEWYSTTFEGYSSDHTYCVIISIDGESQSIDCTGFFQNELWIVIDDEKSINAPALSFYDVNPEENPDAKPIFSADEEDFYE